ncbi:hypothetical protein TWF569_004735 [Orbilia oligospora]|uniref:Uncharacterized protein n=1 Tax=Orbilia oligospora TaxID=2813651 RepID=A0A7C8NNR3_ORBOL|nr:hypothetical protein TWF706_001591 [Orbilia oligospora]KAF3089930.1 hypothetical protein TWF103_000651 [Orbilia oligospora]KAF3105445.1 hypothetical protein TWF102_002359 [Orbilia oligospora]KAF3122655.1 hypothetical protein TWF703_001165 [Orbilia oligospora]KAF3128745.1 hypothetical protein TWF594_011496 [Orbilia oligospora]
MDAIEYFQTNRKKGKAPERLSISEVQIHERKRRRMSSPKSTSTGIFPVDVWHMIADFIPSQDTQTLSVLTRVSKTLYKTLSARLYRDLIVAAPSNRNFPGCIKVLDRYVSISQRDSLRTNIPNPGPGPISALLSIATTIPENTDQNLVPYCARYVKRLLVGWSNPGPERLPILTACLEQAFENLTELEVLIWLDNHISFTGTIGQRLAKLNLKAFAFNFSCPRGPSSLSSIKNLVYLDIFRTHDGSGIRDLLWQSKDTLKTLIYEEGVIPGSDQVDSLKDLLHDGEVIRLPNLTTLCLKINRLTLPEARCLLSNINFPRLAYFEFSTFKRNLLAGQEDEEPFTHQALFEALFEAYGSNVQSERLMLKTFRFRSQLPVYPDRYFLGLLGSFSTLETFIFEETGDNKGDTGKEDVDGLLSALSSHKNLEWLSIHIPYYTEKRWQFSLDHFTRLRDCFPGLKHLACSYEPKKPASRIGRPISLAELYDMEPEMKEQPTFSVLPTMTNLLSYAMPGIRQTNGWMSISGGARLGVILHEIMPEFLRQLRIGEGKRSEIRRWEDRYKLSVLTLGSISFEIKSGSPDEMKDEYEEVFKSADGTLEHIYVRRIPPGRLYDGDYPTVNSMKAVEWRVRNYNGTRGDWLQGIKL